MIKVYTTIILLSLIFVQFCWWVLWGMDKHIYYENHLCCEGRHVRLTFKQFLSLYHADPDHWSWRPVATYFDIMCATYQPQDKQAKSFTITFSYCDFYRFQRWLKKTTKKKEMAKELCEALELTECVREACQIKKEEQIKQDHEALEKVLKETEEQAKTRGLTLRSGTATITIKEA